MIKTRQKNAEIHISEQRATIRYHPSMVKRWGGGGLYISTRHNILCVKELRVSFRNLDYGL